MTETRMTRLAAWSQRHHWTAIVLWVVTVAGISVAWVFSQSQQIHARSAGRLRTSWTWIGAGVLGWSLGQLIWTVYELALHDDRGGSAGVRVRRRPG